jgi:cytochrome c553
LSIKQFRDGNSTGRDTNMSAAVQGVKDADVADLAHYLAHFK